MHQRGYFQISTILKLDQFIDNEFLKCHFQIETSKKLLQFEIESSSV